MAKLELRLIIALVFMPMTIREVFTRPVGLYQPAGWLAAAACWVATVTWQGCRYLLGHCVFNNIGRWPKRAGCNSSMQLPLPLHVLCLSRPVSLSFWFQSSSTWIFTRANQATKSSCSGHSLYWNNCWKQWLMLILTRPNTDLSLRWWVFLWLWL